MNTRSGRQGGAGLGVLSKDERKLQKLEKISNQEVSLKDHFMSHNWEIIVPSFIEENKRFRAKNNEELGAKILIIIKDKNISIIIATNFERQSMNNLKISENGNTLLFKDKTGKITFMEIIRKDNKLKSIPYNSQSEKTGHEYEMKVYTGNN